MNKRRRETAVLKRGLTESTPRPRKSRISARLIGYEVNRFGTFATRRENHGTHPFDFTVARTATGTG